MQKDSNIFLIHILESIGWIEKEIKDVSILLEEDCRIKG